MTKEDLVFEWEPRVPINEDIAAIEHKLVDDYVFVDKNVNNRDDTDNLTALSKNEIDSLNNNKGIEILNDSIVELGDTPIQIIDTENIQNKILNTKKKVLIIPIYNLKILKRNVVITQICNTMKMIII